MKTAVSIPDKIFRQAERIARTLGIPRSQLFARALEEFIGNHDRKSVTERLNELYSEAAPKEDPFLEGSIRELRRATEHDAW